MDFSGFGFKKISNAAENATSYNDIHLLKHFSSVVDFKNKLTCVMFNNIHF